MIASRYYPKLTSVLNVGALPDQLSFIEDGLENLLDDIFVRDYQIVKSQKGDSISYYLVLKVYKRLGIEIPGVFTLLLNPPQIGDPDPLSTEIPISVQIQIEILKYVSNFNVTNFSDDPKSFFLLFLDVLGLETEELFDELINSFSNTNSVSEIVAKINAANGLTGTTNEIPFPSAPTRFEQITEVIDFIESSGSGLTAIGAILVLLTEGKSVDEIKENLNKLFRSRLGISPIDRLKKLFKPKINATLGLRPAIEFPRNVLVPVNVAGEIESDENIKSRLDFENGEFTFSTEGGIGFGKELSVTFPAAYPKAQIGNSGFIIGFTNAKLDLSSETNIPEATADGRPMEFKGVYIETAQIDLPKKWFNADPDNPNPSGVSIIGKNLLIGTGGISGKITLDTFGPAFSAKIGSFKISLDFCDITFHQNSIIESSIAGSLMIDGFEIEDPANPGTFIPAVISIMVHIGNDGEFSVTAKPNIPIPALRIPNILDFRISSLEIGRNSDDKFYVGVGGSIDFLAQGNLGQFLPKDIEIKRMIIYDDGTFEFEGGAIVFSKAYTFELPPLKVSITAIHIGTHEQQHDGNLRKYKYFGFDGGVSLNPGGVDARGKGIKFYFTVDNDLYGGESSRHFFFRIQSLAIDLIISSKANPETALLILKGMLAMQEPTIPPGATPEEIEVLQNSTEYSGSVTFEIPKFKMMAGSAAMRYTPDVPAFIVDIGLEFSQPIVLGATGLGIYGFRALVGRRYITSKPYAGLPEDAEWWQYYKAKVDPDFKEGVQVSKFGPEDGMSFGAGVSLATTVDSGKAFSSKLFLLLSLPDVLIFQGQAQILKERIGLDTLPDPPFFAFVAITNQSVEAAFGVNYKLPDDGPNPGKIVKVDGVTELGFFFGNSSAWYVNIGRETPEERRIQARVVDLFNMYFYLMLSSNGMRVGAGASFELNKKFGPLRLELGAYIDIAGRISRKPKQIGGSIQLGGNVGLYIFKFGFSLSVSAALAAESAKPRIVTGEFEVCIKVLKKEYCAHVELTWNHDNSLDLTEVTLIDPLTLKDSGKSKHMLTDDSVNLLAAYHNGPVDNSPVPYSDIPEPAFWAGGVDKYIIPIDSMLDLEFKKGMYVNGTGVGLDKFGGATGGANNIDFVAPQRGKSDRVRHEYTLNSVEILYFNSNGITGNNWQPFEFYDALTPQVDAPFVDASALANIKYGYWQIDKPNNYNKLKILAQTPLSYLTPGTPLTSGTILPEDFGVTDDTIFCPEEPIAKTCINFNDERKVPAIITSDEYLFYKDILFQIVGQDGTIVANPYLTFPNALSIKGGDTLEIYFKEPIACITLLLQTMATNVTVDFYERASTAPALITDLPSFSYNLIDSGTYTQAQLSSPIEFEYTDFANTPVEKIVITAGMCNPIPEGSTLYCTAAVTTEGNLLQNFFNTLLRNKHLFPTPAAILLFPSFAKEYDKIFFNTLLYNKPLGGRDTVVLTSTFVNNKELSLNIADLTGYNCTTNLKYTGSDPNFVFANATNFSNIRPNPAGMVEGDNYMFLIDVTITTAIGTFVFTLEGISCYIMGECSRECSTFLYQFCYLPVEDALYNLTIPTAAQVAANNTAMVDGMTKTLQPVWRPNTIYAVRISVKDLLYQEGGSSTLANHTKTFIYGFKTTGPVGHYHQYPTASNTEIPKPEFTALKLADREAEFKIHNLGLYIDYPKCYPNADSDLINSKPLYYKNPKFLVFYTKPYVYQFYNNWDAYGLTEALESSIEVLIKDPAEKAFTGTTPTVPMSGVTGWITTQNLLDPSEQIIPQDILLLSNMIDNGNGCFTYPTPLLPIGIANEITCDDLLPLKLYTALMNAKYQRMITDTVPFVREVHRYSFETSRYGDFTEQINSYILKSHIDTITSLLVIDKAAIFTNEQLIVAADITIAQQFVVNPNSVSDNLIQEYGHPFDRIIDGILKVKRTINIDALPLNDIQTQPLPPSVTTVPPSFRINK